MTPAEAALLESNEVVLGSSSSGAGQATADLQCSPAGATNGYGGGQAVAAALMANVPPVPSSENGDQSGTDSRWMSVAVASEDGSRAYSGSLSPNASVLTSDSTPDPLWCDNHTAPIGGEASGGVPASSGNRTLSAAPAGDGAEDGRWRDDPRDTLADSAPSPESDSGRTRSDAPWVSAGVDAPEDGEDVASAAPTPPLTDDLAILHATMSHYAREFLDVQKLRIAQGNRVGAMERDGIPDEFIAFARDTHDTLAKKERAVNAYLKKQASRHFLAPWVLDQRGIGLPGFARLLGITGPLDRFATVSKLWAYLGLHTVDGVAPRKKKGERANWSQQGRVLCCQIGESIVKMGKGGEYREAYDTKKAEYAEKRPEWTPAHRHAAARRYAVKRLVRRMWLAWRRYQREGANDHA